MNLTEWNGRTNPFDAKFATRLHVQAPAPFLDDLEGKFWRLPDGQTGRLLRFGFYQRLAVARRAAPITIRSKATVETLSGSAEAGAAGNQRLGLETEVRGLIPGAPGTRGAVRIKLVRRSGAEVETTHSLAYDRSWRFRSSTEFALNVGVVRTTQATARATEPSLRLSWRGDF